MKLERSEALGMIAECDNRVVMSRACAARRASRPIPVIRFHGPTSPGKGIKAPAFSSEGRVSTMTLPPCTATTSTGQGLGLFPKQRSREGIENLVPFG